MKERNIRLFEERARGNGETNARNTHVLNLSNFGWKREKGGLYNDILNYYFLFYYYTIFKTILLYLFFTFLLKSNIS